MDCCSRCWRLGGDEPHVSGGAEGAEDGRGIGNEIGSGKDS